MSDISKIKTPSGDTYDIKDANAVSDIVKSGSNITITKRNGSSSVFAATKVVVSETQPVGGTVGDIWLVLTSDE